MNTQQLLFAANESLQEIAADLKQKREFAAQSKAILETAQEEYKASERRARALCHFIVHGQGGLLKDYLDTVGLDSAPSVSRHDADSKIR